MENKITIVIPLYDRQDKTKIFFKNNINKKINYFFCDGGKTNLNENFIKNKLNENIIYKKFITDKYLPYDYLKKILVSIKKVSTKYIMLADNDDFLNVNAILKCVNFLENNKEFQLASGDTLHIRNSSKKNLYHITPGIRSSRIYDNKKGLQNIFNYYSLQKHNHIVYYSIFRKKFLIKIFNELITIPNFSMHHFEYFFNSLVIFSGRYKYINCVHYVRLQNSSQSLNVELNKNKNKKDDILIKSSFNRLKNISSKKFNFNKNEFEKLLNNYFNSHEKRKKENKFFKFIRIKNNFFSIFYIYPLRISTIIKKIDFIKKINFYL